MHETNHPASTAPSLRDTAAVSRDGVTATIPRTHLFLLPILGVVLTLGAGGMLWYLSQQLARQNLASASEDAAVFARSVTQYRNFYASEIVPRARSAGMEITHAYKHLPNALPLPATFTLDFGQFVSEQRQGFAVQLYSAHPFPWRAHERRLDAFQREALAALARQPERPFVRTELIDGVPTLRYAVADHLKEVCVACHNSYPGSPKTDWKVGDVRGVLEVRRSLLAANTSLHGGLRNAAYASGALIIAVLLLMWLAMGGMRRAVLAANRANRQLREAQRSLEQQIFALDQHAIVSMADPAGNIVYANDRFCAISGYAREELIGRNHRIVNSGLHPREFFEGLWRTIRAGEVWSGELCNRRKDGSLYWVSATIVPFLDESGQPVRYIGIRTDISQRKEWERETLCAKEVAEAANRSKSEFLANMSHEIRTPMNGIIGMADLALDADNEDERQEYLGIVKRSAESLLVILNDILDFSKIEANKLHLERVGFDLRQALTDTLKVLRPRAEEKGLKLLLDLAADLPARVVGDPTRLRQVLVNLVGNAIKFTTTGEIVVHGRIDARNASTAVVRLAVRDSGIGIAPDKLETIFDAFSQADASTTRKYGGTGLGLSISSRLVELMGGHMEVESEPGRGSVFHFTVALGLEPVPAPASTPVVAPVAVRDMPALRILLVEDDPINQQLALRLLRKWGHAVTLAKHGREAVERLEAGERPDIVLMDMQMPVLDGVEATRLIRAHERARGLPRVTILAMTANAMQGDREICLEAGMDDYLSKPIDQVELAAKLRHFAPSPPATGA